MIERIFGLNKQHIGIQFNQLNLYLYQTKPIAIKPGKNNKKNNKKKEHQGLTIQKFELSTHGPHSVLNCLHKQSV